VLLGSQSLKCVGFNFCCTAANVAATLAASMALPTDTDNDPGDAPAARAASGDADGHRRALEDRIRTAKTDPTSELADLLRRLDDEKDKQKYRGD
jgi:hypothetical protein